VLPKSFDLIPTMIGSDVWQERYAAIMAISSMGEGCASVMGTELFKIVRYSLLPCPQQTLYLHLFSLVLPHLIDSNPRVRHASCNCIGQLSTDFPVLPDDILYVVKTSHLCDRISFPKIFTPLCFRNLFMFWMTEISLESNPTLQLLL
jgi:hypothetical protein